MGTKRKTLGELIEYVVRKQGLTITAFANKIYCTRNNAYHLFKRGDKIDAAQLKLISKVLGHNFFEDLANDDSLIDLENADIKRDIINKKAVSQFLEIMPKVLMKLNLSPMIVLSKMDELWGAILPDFGLVDIPISFTIGQRLFDKMDGNPGQCLKVESFPAPCDTVVDAWLNEPARSVMLDIPILFHTEEEWLSIMSFAINEIQPKYGVLCSYGGSRIDREIAYNERKDL